MLKTLDKVSDRIEVEVEEELFAGPDDPLQILAERLAEAILAEPGLPLDAVRVAKADLPPDDQDQEHPEIGFYLKLACGRKRAFEWLRHLSSREHEIAQALSVEERKLFDRTFYLGIKWEQQE